MNLGDYVRTQYGIAKYISDKVTKYSMYYVVDKDIMTCNVDGWENCLSGSNEIIKSSPNIIDLFEEHDLVVIEYYSLRYNERVTRLFEVNYKDKEFMTLKNAYCDFMLRNNKFNDEDKKLKPIIKSILTHEQFESMEYKVGELV